MTIINNGYTRGNGLFEPILAHWRARRANQLIPTSLRSGRILDIGCGTRPYFLARTSFQHKFAIDQIPLNISSSEHQEIKSYTIDLNDSPKLPFPNDFFSVITLLAVVEHLNPKSMARLFRETHRVLQPGGIVIITTPAAWAAGLLRFLSWLRVVSPEEINEHVYAYTLPLLGWYFGQAGYDMQKIKFGYFELTFNMWATAEKSLESTSL